MTLTAADSSTYMYVYLLPSSLSGSLAPSWPLTQPRVRAGVSRPAWLSLTQHRVRAGVSRPASLQGRVAAPTDLPRRLLIGRQGREGFPESTRLPERGVYFLFPEREMRNERHSVGTLVSQTMIDGHTPETTWEEKPSSSRGSKCNTFNLT